MASSFKNHCTVGMGNPLAVHIKGKKSPISAMIGDVGEMEIIAASIKK